MTTGEHTMRAEPPTAAEVRAVARLWRNHDDCAVVLLRVQSRSHNYTSMHVASVLVEQDGQVDGYAAADMNHLYRADAYLMLSPDGTLSWARVAELVAAMAAPVATRPADYDGGAVCTRCNGSRVVDGDACVCAGGGL